ncbi:conserved hypothetical protein [Thermosediminibacter oceani DSM 16646]|uniref:Uncharacterized protein n=1 Tax=Thermosediminibacter oceani (strain ATCC BAA-1034 / DSM 16646 / JW/IW-1228P) TaxID=555079 RepID=D9RZS9_THEOJ|nr:conserved hypothetical protein [Thermosediminibacter oceani DSM 16646]
MFTIPVLQRKIFYVLLSIVWGSFGIYSMIHSSFADGLKILIFGGIFISFVAIIQAYVIKMLQMYDNNLKKQDKG